jgi:hypothetical protein
MRGLYQRCRRNKGSTGIRLFNAARASAKMPHGGKLIMIAQELEVSLHLAFVEARQKKA